MFRILIIFILLIQTALCNAQQLQMMSEYTYNGFVLNPGMLGWEGISAVSAVYRHQWTEMPNAPKTAALSFRHHDDRRRMTFGGYLIHDQLGPTGFTGVSLNYAYTIPFKSNNGYLKNNKLALGMSLSGLGYRLNGADLRYQDANDPLIIQNNMSRFYPDFGIGALYSNDLYYVGVSIPQLIPFKINFEGDQVLSSIRRMPHFYIHGGAMVNIFNNMYPIPKHNHNIMPSFWIKYTPTAPLNINFNLHYIFDNLFSVGVGYGSEGTCIADFSIYFLKNYRIGYAYSFGLNELAPQLGSNHEIMLTYVFRSTGKGWFIPKVQSTLFGDRKFERKLGKVSDSTTISSYSTGLGKKDKQKKDKK